MQDAVEIVEACIVCAQMYEVDQQLMGKDIDVKGIGLPLSNYLKEGWKTITI